MQVGRMSAAVVVIGTQAAFVLVVPVSAAGVGPPGMGLRHNRCLDADVADGASCHHDSHAHCNDFPADVSHKHFPLGMWMFCGSGSGKAPLPPAGFILPYSIRSVILFVTGNFPFYGRS